MALRIDTTQGSAPHKVANGVLGVRPSVLKLYLSIAVIAYLPLLAAASFGAHPLMTRTDAVRLPFLLDWNVAFMLLVSLPTLAIVMTSDDRILAYSLNKVQHDGIVEFNEDSAERLRTIWETRFRRINRTATIVGVICGAILLRVNYSVYTPSEVGYWIAANNKLLPAGYLYLFWVFIFYALIAIYVIRSATMSLFLQDVVAHSELGIVPFHPDNCGGLSPVGRLGLRNQYMLSVFGVNIVLLVAVSLFYLPVPTYTIGLIVAAVAAYLLLGPLVFLGPLLPFRAGMQRKKVELISEAAEGLRAETQLIRCQLKRGEISKSDEENLERLRSIGTMIGQLPVWPFDAGTLRRFLSAYVIPVASAVIYPVLSGVVERVKELFQH